mmetsp:Transcript_64120/g.119218  ORF Transcript_64120/g.119218 Transcript_64120/m.119218 type:complete len:197 (-) Transcript_64120:52-642(-)
MLRRSFGLDDTCAVRDDNLLEQVGFHAAGVCTLPKGMAHLMYTGFLAGPTGSSRHRTAFPDDDPPKPSGDDTPKAKPAGGGMPSVGGDVHHDQRFSRSYTYTNIDGKMDVQETETRCKDGNCQTIARHMVPDAPEKGDKETKLVLVEPPGVETRKQVVLMSPQGYAVPSGTTTTVAADNVSMPGQRVMYMTNSTSG